MNELADINYKYNVLKLHYYYMNILFHYKVLIICIIISITEYHNQSEC